MADVYSIANWDSVFETAQSRKVKGALSWVAVKTKHDTGGFRRLMAEEDGVSLYGAWMLIVEVAAKMPTRGVLATDDGPLDADDLSFRTGAPPEIFKKAFTVLCKPKIGWMLVAQWERAGSTVGACSHRMPATVHNSTVQYRTEPDKTEQNNTGSAPENSYREKTGSDRKKRGVDPWRQKFVLKILEAGAHPSRFDAERRPMLKLSERFVHRRDREAILDRCLAIAAEKASAGLDKPMAAFTAEVNKLWP